MTPIENLLAKLPDAKRVGNGWSTLCPAHEDRRASLSISEGDNGGAVLHCHGGCEPAAVVEALGLSLADLMPLRTTIAVKPMPSGSSRIVATYDYCDERGNLLFQVCRKEPKDFCQRKPKPGGWEYSVKGVRVVPYQLPRLLAHPRETIFIVEGEKDVESLTGIMLLATCNAGGAEKWTAEHAQYLHGRHVVILPDNDEAGRRHAQQVAMTLHGVAAEVRIVELPGLPPKGDVSDWLAAGGTREELIEVAKAASIWTPESQPWADLLPFDAAELPEFPTHVLPRVLRQWGEAESHATQTPPDLACLLAVAVCSAMIARKVEVEPRPGWREPTNIYTAVLLEPGNRKSAVFSDATRPLRNLETEMIEAARATVAQLQSDRRQAETRLRKLEKVAAESGDVDARHEAGNLAAELAEQPEPALPRLLVDDATSEKLGMVLAEQGGRVASMSPEGGVFDLMAGLYSKSGAPQFGVYLMGHSGDDLIVDRVSRKGVRVERPALTCAYAMQPAVIEGLAENAAFRGRGLLGRFLYAAPQSWIGRREIAPEPVADATKKSYCQAVRALADIDECTLRLDAEASALLREWEAEIESMLGDGGEMESMRDWGAKLAGATLRVAAVLHCVEHGAAGYIGASTIRAAIEIAKYLIPHAEAVLNMMHAKESSDEDGARYVLRWMERHGLGNFTKRDAHQHGKRRFSKADDIDPALAELTRRGYIRLRPAEAGGPGRPPSPSYEVNPAAFNEDPQKRSQNSQNPAPQPEAGDSENIENALGLPENPGRVRVTI